MVPGGHCRLLVQPPCGVQTLLTQVVPAGQTWPQAPQLFWLLAVFVQTPPQRVVGGEQGSWLHEPRRHWPLPPGGAGQTMPQPPQLNGSVCVKTQ